jgi:hypothetical protein
MNDLIDRYLDGELTEEEARTLLAQLARDPELAADLRAMEAALAVDRSVDARPAPGFADAVMDRIAALDAAVDVHPLAASRAPAGDPVPLRREGRAAWTAGSRWALAALLVLAVGLGAVLARLGLPQAPGAAERGGGLAADGDRAAPTAVHDAADPGPLTLVRLIHVPEGEAPARVAVAGTFNDWSTVVNPLRREDGVWTTVLLLPPGTYEYMFVEDDERWVTDRFAVGTRDDGFGRENAVLDVSM